MRIKSFYAVLVSFAAVAILAADASAVYHPTLGRFMQRDPGSEGPAAPRIGQYRDGMGLYQYVKSSPTRYVDPSGLWGKDVHGDLTRNLAQRAGIACPDAVAAGANAPDSGWRRPGAAGVAHVAALSRVPIVGYALAAAKAAAIAEWHFPSDADGVVRPDSAVANAKANAGIENCNFGAFSEGLHVLQDSWSHQGTPYVAGMGHERGVKEVFHRYTETTYVPPNLFSGGGGIQTREQWFEGLERTDGSLEAALSGSADVVDYWKEDVRATAMATYRALKRFKDKCPCHCPGPNGTKVRTSSGEAQPEAAVGDWLRQTYPNENVK